MKIIALFFVAAALTLAACKQSPAPNAAATTTTTAASTTVATPSSDPKAAFVERTTDCICQFWSSIAELHKQNDSLPESEQDKKKAVIAKMEALLSSPPECMRNIKQEGAKVTENMSADQRRAFMGAELEAATAKKCPEAADIINKKAEAYDEMQRNKK